LRRLFEVENLANTQEPAAQPAASAGTSDKMHIIVLEDIGVAEARIKEIAEPITNQGHQLTIYTDKVSDTEILKERVKDADILVIANSKLTGEVIKAAPHLKMISVAFTGVDHIDLETCKEKKLVVCNAAGYSVAAVAELAFGLMVSLLRNILPLDQATRQGGTVGGYGQRELYGKILGVVGTGNIGSRVAELGLAFGCKVIAYNRSEKEALQTKGVKYMSLENVLKNSDIVSIHLPLTEETRGLIDKNKLILMRPEAILINTARGPIIDNQALAEMLEAGRISGAAIDVFDMEPPLPNDYPLLRAKSTVLTPHIGYATQEAMQRRANIVFQNILAWLNHQPENVIEYG